MSPYLEKSIRSEDEVRSRRAYDLLMMRLWKVKREVADMTDYMSIVKKNGLHGLDAVDASSARDSLREIANELNDLIGNKDLKT